jgi:hypothetical protein
MQVGLSPERKIQPNVIFCTQRESFFDCGNSGSKVRKKYNIPAAAIQFAPPQIFVTKKCEKKYFNNRNNILTFAFKCLFKTTILNG